MSNTMTIKTNNVPRNVLQWFDLTVAERGSGDFDYLDTVDAQASASFFRYRGTVYDLSEFMYIDKTVAPHPQRQGWEDWDGYHSDSFFSGLLVRYVEDCERVIVATYYC